MKTKTVVPMMDEKTKKITTVYYSDGSVDYLNAAKNQTLAYVERNAIFLAKSNWLNNIKNFAILFLFSAIFFVVFYAGGYFEIKNFGDFVLFYLFSFLFGIGIKSALMVWSFYKNHVTNFINFTYADFYLSAIAFPIVYLIVK